MKVAVLIPCYNEAITIGKVVDDFKRELPEADIYVYDNNSKDGRMKLRANMVQLFAMNTGRVRAMSQGRCFEKSRQIVM